MIDCMSNNKNSLATKGMTAFRRFMSRPYSSAILADILLIIAFTIGTPNFLSSTNIFNVLRNASLFTFTAMTQVPLILIGGMSVSAGAIGGMSVIFCGIMMQNVGLNPWLTALLAIVFGSLLGLFNAIIITRFNLSAFVATLSTSFIYTGLVYGISKGTPYTGVPEGFTVLGRGELLGLPLVFWLMCVMLILLAVFFKYFLTGRRILATGGNSEAARMSGIRTNRVIVLCNVMSGFFAAITGVLYVSRLGSAPPAVGQDWMLTAFAVGVIGGVSVKGGVFSAVGLFFSGIMMAMIKNGLVMLGVNQYYEQTFLGAIILIAVIMESIRKKFAGKLQSA